MLLLDEMLAFFFVFKTNKGEKMQLPGPERSNVHNEDSRGEAVRVATRSMNPKYSLCRHSSVHLSIE